MRRDQKDVIPSLALATEITLSYQPFAKSFNEEEVSGVLLGEVNADDEWFEETADKLKIRGIPVLIGFKGGEEKERIVGAAQRLAIMDFFGRNK